MWDSHCHLNLIDLQPYGGRVEAVIEQARQAGVVGMICIGVDLASQDAVMALAHTHEEVYASVGVHPCHLAGSLPERERLLHYAQQPRVVAIGETGLDYHHEPEAADLQRQSLLLHIELAKQLDKPLVIHTRQARADTLALLRQAGERAGVMHCFTEDWETAKAALDLGFYISFSGIVSFKNAEDLREVARRVPDDRLLIETDSPWLAPVPHRGKSNCPAWVADVARCVAEVRKVPLDTLIETTSANTRRLFRLP